MKVILTKLKKYMKKILSYFLKIYQPKNYIQYYRFGFNVSGYLREDLKNSFFGTQNLFKHFQAPCVIKALDIKSYEKVLDFGCGTGFMSIEIAKLADKTVGVDINPYIKECNIPYFLKNKLSFQLYDEFIDKKDMQFDKILLSEVIFSVSSLEELFVMLKKKLKLNGKIILVNGLNKCFVKSIYQNNFVLKFFNLINSKIPDTYEEYEEKLCSKFGNKTKRLLSKEEIIELFSKYGYKNNYDCFSPSSILGNIIELRQFVMFPKMKHPNFIFFIIYRLIFFIFKFWPVKYKSGYIAEFSREGRHVSI